MDNGELFPSHLVDCEHFQAVVSGKYALGWFHLSMAEEHWDKCHECQSGFPHARLSLAQVKEEFKAESKDNIARIYHEFMSKKHSLSVEAGNYHAILIELAQCAEAIQWELNSIHEICDGEFHVLPVPDKDSEGVWEDVRSELAPFIRSLGTKDQHFVFSAILASESFVGPLPTEAGLISENNDTDEDHSPPVRRLKFGVPESEVKSFALLALIEKAAVVYLQEYLRKTKSRPTESVQPHKDNIQSIVRDLRQDWKNDFRDTLTAIRIETSQLYESKKCTAASYESDLEEKLTSHIYNQLEATTRRALQLAEYFYSLNNEPDGFAPAVAELAKAYEYEFHVRITKSFASDLLRQGIRSYPPSGSRQLIRGGNVSVHSIGDVVYYLKNDADMKSFLVRNRLDPYAIACDADNVTRVRNPLVHDSEGNIGHVETLRKLLLNGKSSIFAHLMPSDEEF
jgi:hypothetical protein